MNCYPAECHPAGHSQPGDESILGAEDKYVKAAVSIVRCEDYTPSKVLKAVLEAVNLLGGIGQFVRPGQKVLLKPNLLSPRPPESAVTTHPAVVEAVIGLANSAGGSCFLGDSPSIGGDTPENYERLLRTTGMSHALDRAGAQAVRFDDSGTEQEVAHARVCRRLLVADAVREADVLINLPKFKTHELTLMTGAVKNLFGCIPGRRKVEFHLKAGDNPEMFAQILVDTLKAVRPGLSILDAIVGMDGQGPSAGRRRNFGLIMASTDPVALDAVVCMVAGIEPMKIPTLRLASKQGLGTVDPAEIEVVGLQPEEVLIPDFLLPPRGDIVSRLPKPLYRMLRNHLVKRPTFLRDRCSACGACVDICPVQAISGEGNRLRVDYSVCIRCYCCQEVCPEEAIALRMSRLRGAFDAALTTRRRIRRILRRQS